MNKFFVIFWILFINGVGLILYKWNKENNQWNQTLIQKNTNTWYSSNVAVLIQENNQWKIKIFNAMNNSFINIEDWQIKYSFLDKNIHILQNLKQSQSTIHIIETKIPIEILENYLIKNNIIINTPFIIFNILDNKILIHNYFFYKSQTLNDYKMINLINLNNLTHNNLHLILEECHINDHNIVLFANRNINEVNNLLQSYQTDNSNN